MESLFKERASSFTLTPNLYGLSWEVKLGNSFGRTARRYTNFRAEKPSMRETGQRFRPSMGVTKPHFPSVLPISFTG